MAIDTYCIATWLAHSLDPGYMMGPVLSHSPDFAGREARPVPQKFVELRFLRCQDPEPHMVLDLVSEALKRAARGAVPTLPVSHGSKRGTFLARSLQPLQGLGAHV